MGYPAPLRRGKGLADVPRPHGMGPRYLHVRWTHGGGGGIAADCSSIVGSQKSCRTGADPGLLRGFNQVCRGEPAGYYP